MLTVNKVKNSGMYGTHPAKSSVGKPILSCDFDGVIHSYTSGWHGAEVVYDEPVEGAMEFLTAATNKFEVAIFSTRTSQPGGIAAMYEYIEKHLHRYWADKPKIAEIVLSKLKFPTDKPSALVCLDDRAVIFTGTFPDVDELLAFKPWNQQASDQ